MAQLKAYVAVTKFGDICTLIPLYPEYGEGIEIGEGISDFSAIVNAITSGREALAYAVDIGADTLSVFGPNILEHVEILGEL